MHTNSPRWLMLRKSIAVLKVSLRHLTSPIVDLILDNGRESVAVICCEVALHACLDLLELVERCAQVSADEEHLSVDLVSAEVHVGALNEVGGRPVDRELSLNESVQRHKDHVAFNVDRDKLLYQLVVLVLFLDETEVCNRAQVSAQEIIQEQITL